MLVGRVNATFDRVLFFIGLDENTITTGVAASFCIAKISRHPIPRSEAERLSNIWIETIVCWFYGALFAEQATLQASLPPKPKDEAWLLGFSTTRVQRHFCRMRTQILWRY